MKSTKWIHSFPVQLWMPSNFLSQDYPGFGYFSRGFGIFIYTIRDFFGIFIFKEYRGQKAIYSTNLLNFHLDFMVLKFRKICNKKIRKKISKRMRLEIISSVVNTTVMNFSVLMVFVFEVFTTDLAQSIHDKFHWVRIHNSTKSASEGKNKRGQLNSSPCFQNRFLNP